ncbi:S9 family peptidase [Natronococcus occultus]|uniref:Dipeptidyl aminopeptidase/acylaminoacyl peptidase n=1 Tax=Natronococcus occultus SP4 TaxID=694430 RepID=L0JT66_9EURY|nr:S9 family peptidase [Natronococcus occultus]AGB35926.1 dipeptidyl aminopeptidase/acylaminoacyl peptidase [Natronococcus occultus SP4]
MNRIEAADYHEIVHATEPRLAPDGERVAFVRRTPEDEETTAATIHVVPVGGGEPRQFTAADGVDGQPRWSPDGEFLAFASTRGEDDRQQLWLLPTDGGEARRLTGVVGGIDDLEWSPNGERLLFTQRVTAADREDGRDRTVDPDYEPETPDPRVIDRMIYRAGTEYVDGRRSHVYVLEVEAALEGAVDPADGDDTGAAITRLTDGDDDYVGPTWGDAGTVYYATKAGDQPDDSVIYDLVEHDVETDERTEFTRTTGWIGGLDATADGRVAFEYTPEERLTLGQTELRVHDRETGTETTPTVPLDRTVDHKSTFEWDPEGESLYFTTPDTGSKVLWTVPADGSEEPTRVYGEDVTVESFSVGRDAVAVVQSEWDHPGDLFLTTRGGAETVRLTRLNDGFLADRAVRQPEEVWFESERTAVQGWVLTPPDFDPDETYPLVVEIHGGPHSQWTTAGTMWHEFQTLAARGYVVFWSNPRGSTGYGEDHMSAIERDWGDVTLTDVLAGIDAVCEREYVDEDELFVTGGSFGGFMTAWTVGHTDRFTAAVSQRGVYDLAGFYGSTDAFKLLEGDFGTTPWEEPEFLWKRSPVAHVPDVETPTLVVHSDQDYRTPANTAELFYLGLKKHGVDTRLVRYPREGHELSRSGEPGHVVDRIERIARWFDGYSSYCDAPPALERERDAGLSSAATADEADE